MRARLAIIIVLSLALTGCFFDYQWRKFSDPDRTFAVELPNAPAIKKVHKDAANPYALDEYVVALGSAALLVVVGDHRGRQEDGASAIAASVKALHAQAASDFSEQPAMMDGHNGTLARWRTKSDSIIVDRVFFVGDRRYQVMTVLPVAPTDGQRAVASRFVTSFHFLH